MGGFSDRRHMQSDIFGGIWGTMCNEFVPDGSTTEYFGPLLMIFRYFDKERSHTMPFANIFHNLEIIESTFCLKFNLYYVSFSFDGF